MQRTAAEREEILQGRREARAAEKGTTQAETRMEVGAVHAGYRAAIAVTFYL